MLIDNIIFWPLYALLWFAVVRYDVHMFQHNSYREERYARWFKGGFKYGRAAIIAALAIVGFFSNPVFLGFSAVFMAALAWREFRTVYKKPIVYTMRVKRLFLTAALFSAVVIGAVAYFTPQYAKAIALVILVIPVVMLTANLLNKPLEALISRWYYNDARRILRSMPDLKIIGITGSFGKTSTKHYLYRILSEKYNVLMTPGNFNTTLGVIRTVREQLKPHHQVFIVEMGAKQRGDIKEICDLVHPTIGIVTAVGEMHLETFGSIEGVLKTKFELIDALPANGLGVTNIDSEPIAESRLKHHCNTISYSVENSAADYRATDVNYQPQATSFAIDIRGDKNEGYVTHLAGRGNILNLLAAIAVADELGVPTSMQKRAIRQIEQIEHRLSMRRAGGVTILDDAYNSTPEGARMALEVLGGFVTEGRRYVVTPGFVEMGERQYANNRAFGEDIARANCDEVYVVNEVNRAAITEGLLAGGYDVAQTHCVASFQEAMAELQPKLKAGDVVLYENDLPDSFK